MQTEAERKAVAKYHSKFDDIKVRVPKGHREQYKQYAESRGLSLNQIIIKLMTEDMQKHSYQLEDNQSTDTQSDTTE